MKLPDIESVVLHAKQLADQAAALSDKAVSLSEETINAQIKINQVTVTGVDPFMFAVTIFVLACFIGYFVVWKVTPALHTPLMSVTNAISSIVIVGALLAANSVTSPVAGMLGLAAVFLVSINIFGGFIVTQRMLHMFKKKD